MLPVALLGAIAAFLFLNYDSAGPAAQSAQSTQSAQSDNSDQSAQSDNSDQKANSNQDLTKKSYKYLVNDLMDHHGMSQTKWNKNIRINKTSDGIGIGSDEAFILVSDSKPIKLYIGKSKYPLNTWDTNEAVNKLLELIKSDKLNKEDQNKVTKVLDLLLKYKNYYFFKKYNHYKKKYVRAKKS